MRESGRDIYSRNSKYHEIVVNRMTSYSELAKKASIEMKMPLKDGKLALFKVSGAIISCDDIPCNRFKESRPWTISNYLQLLAKKSPSGVKIGVGYISTDEQSEVKLIYV